MPDMLKPRSSKRSIVPHIPSQCFPRSDESVCEVYAILRRTERPVIANAVLSNINSLIEVFIQ